MTMKLLVTVTMALFASEVSFAQMQKTASPKLIEKTDRKAEKQDAKDRKKEAAEKEEIGRREFNTWSEKEQDDSPWTNWYRKGKVKALLELSDIRHQLFKNNLFDNYVERPKASVPCGKSDRMVRRFDGTCNDVEDSMAGAAMTRMGRNVKPEAAQQDKNLFYPDPRKISRELMTRDEFKPVGFLNLHAASWIQFMTHDWFSHGENEPDGAYGLVLDAEDPIRQSTKADYMIFQRTRKDETRTAKDSALGPTHLNEVTHWWDGSQIYGSDATRAKSLRTFVDGKLKLSDKGLLPRDLMGAEEAGFNRNWWLGLSTLHTLFVKEHNAIAEHLKSKYPLWSDEALYQKARLITAALIAKIHTIEWTPAIIPNRTLYTAMNANWKGLINSSYKVEPWFRFFDQDVLFGLMAQKKAKNAGVPFHLTEEFTSVYRMHSLLPDALDVLSLKNGEKLKTYDLMELRENNSGKIMDKYDTSDIMYSFGVQNPGQLVLNNVPKSMQNVEVPFSGVNQRGIIDIGAMDVFRDRERGVPRYNELRRQLGLKPIRGFEDLTKDPVKLKKLRDVYNNDIEMIDAVIGCLAEEIRPTNYGFGETAFQVFIAMASRRLMTDRFYTEDYTPEVYTREGINWVDQNNFKTILLRHYPKLDKALFGVKNAFNPWNSETSAKK
jgi:hypothetical protein